MDDNQNDRINPKDNPFNQSEISLGEHYDEFGNRIVKQKNAEPSVAQVIEEDLGIGNTEEDQQKTRLSASSLRPSTNVKPNTRSTNFFGGSTGVETNLSSNDRIAHNNQDVKHVHTEGIERGPEGNRTPGTELDRFIPHQAGPTDSSITNHNKSKKFILVVIILLVAAGLIFTLYQTRFNTAKIGAVPSFPKESDIIKRVGNLVELPISEQPSQIANVSDVARLTSNPFFANAQNGDVVLLYQKNKTAILYRPRTGKIVAIGPFNLSNGQVAGQSTTASITPSPSASPSSSQSPGKMASPSPTLIP